MAKRLDDGKRRMWEQRLRQFRISGLTVAAFCARESLAVPTFYYWSRRVGSPAAGANSVRRDRRSRSPVGEGMSRGGGGTRHTHWIHFRLGAKTCVSIPADCLEALRCLVRCLADASAGQQDAFREVLLSARS